MAQESNNDIKRFDGSLSNDVKDYHLKENQWTHLRNGTIEFGTNNVTNEPANKSCITTSYPIIGYIYLYDDQWLIFSTDDTNSEIGLFKELTCNYSTLISAPADNNVVSCLNFNRNNLITGVAKQNFDCSWSVYWSDGHRNHDRTLNINKIPWIGVAGLDPNGCYEVNPTIPLRVDCQQLKLNRNAKIPCVKALKGSSGGSLLNGSYCVTMAYTMNGQRVTNYLCLSNVIGLFNHEGLNSSLEITLSDLDDSYDEYELVVISVTGGQSTVAKRIGLYSTNQKKVFLDIISNTLPPIPLEFIPVHNPLIESSTSITDLDNMMLRIGPRSKFDFNYQPLANQILSSWVSVEYPADYYRDGGINLNAMRDENLALFIRWVYEDSDKSASFHIPGRAPVYPEQSLASGIYDGDNFYFENNNTAQQTDNSVIDLGDGGFQIAEGTMGYYETEERYPINKPTVWGSLCGKKIRHHKFPDRSLTDRTNIYVDSGVSTAGAKIRVMGVKFYNIKAPVDNNGVLIPGIVGYEILRGSRDGNKTIIAKGIINNLFTYGLENTTKSGAYPNFPYNDLGDDPYISTTIGITDKKTGVLSNITPNPGYYTQGGLNFGFQHELATFHSPDTTFTRPYLGAKELKLDGIISGHAAIRFYEPVNHPKNKMLTNYAYFIASLGGLGLAVLKMSGQRTTSTGLPFVGGATGLSALGTAALVASILSKVLASRQDNDTINQTYNDYGDVVKARDTDVDTIDATDRTTANTLNIAEAAVMNTSNKVTNIAGGLGNALGSLFRAVGGVSLFSQQWSEGTSSVLNIILDFSQWQQYALQQISHCFYNNYGDSTGINPTPRRFSVVNCKYLDPVIQEFDEVTTINNLYRSRTVALRTYGYLPHSGDFDNALRDVSKQTLQTLPNPMTTGIYDEPTYHPISAVASSYYASLKLRLRNQYGQIGDVKQIPVGCVNDVVVNYANPYSNVYVSPVIFCGDTYITRYTEKNTMFFFYDWMYNQFDGAEFDYFKHRMVKYPAYWINTTKLDFGDFVRGLTDGLGGQIVSLINPGLNTQPDPNINNSPWLPSGFMALDRAPGSANVTQPSNGLLNHFFQNNSAYKNSLFIVKSAYYYLFCSGVRDFYVESEINLGYRDWEEPVQKRFYDSESYTDLPAMFKADPDVIKADNFYKYDYSLTAAKAFTEMISWANIQPTWYDPIVAEKCYTFHPKRVNYSLPQQFEQIKDSYRIFLANNYRDFRSVVTTIKSIGDNGAIILFDSDRPLMLQGTETLQTIKGTKLTIGDGELFDKPQQSLNNADKAFQYGSCQNLRSIVNTPAGLFYISQRSGKIFTVGNGLLNIAMQDMNWWFSKYLPFQILQGFPTCDLLDNAVTSVGCQTAYDNKTGIIYFSKKDYRFKPESLLPGYTATYDSITKSFLILFPVIGNGGNNGNTDNGGSGGGGDTAPGFNIFLDDPIYFENVSWTISYDTKQHKWLGHQDWIPDLIMPSQNTFSTIKGGGIWQHNVRCDLYCNYYGIDYPFEIEFPYNTGVNVETLRSVEYYMEVYKYASNCNDRYLYLFENFDEAIVWNNEQCSGLLKLNVSPINNPFAMLNYPIFNLNTVDTIYSKVESKYRINQFTDLTDDRGEFSNARRMIWETDNNGYVKNLNNVNLNYQKSPLEQKAFRGYQGSLFLRKKISGDSRFVMLFAVNKFLDSKR